MRRDGRQSRLCRHVPHLFVPPPTNNHWVGCTRLFATCGLFETRKEQAVDSACHILTEAAFSSSDPEEVTPAPGCRARRPGAWRCGGRSEDRREHRPASAYLQLQFRPAMFGSLRVSPQSTKTSQPLTAAPSRLCPAIASNGKAKAALSNRSLQPDWRKADAAVWRVGRFTRGHPPRDLGTPAPQ